MNEKRPEIFYARVENLTRKWWFYAALLLLFFIPAISERPAPLSGISSLVIAVLSKPLIYMVPALFPLFKIIPVILVLGLIVLENRMKSTFNVYAAFFLFGSALFQNSALTGDYGFTVLTGNLVVTLVVASAWLWEAIAGKGDYSLVRPPWWRNLVMPLVLFAFWYPAGFTQGVPVPDFNPALLVTNEAGLTYCMMLPFFIGTLSLYYPRVNKPVFRITAFAGLATSVFGLVAFFILKPDYWWMGILHLPLFAISLYCFLLSFHKAKEYPVGGIDREELS